MPVIGKENAPNRLRNFKNMGKEDVSREISVLCCSNYVDFESLCS